MGGDSRKFTDAAVLADAASAATLFASMFDRAHFSMQIFHPSGACVYVNPAWSAIWGPSLELVRGYNILHDPQIETTGIKALIFRAFQGESVVIPPVYYDPHLSPGSPEGLARWCSADASSIYSSSGQLLWVMLRHQDVTREQVAMDRVAETEQLFDAMFNQSNDAVFLHDTDGRFVRINRRACDMFGLPEQGVETYSIRDLHPSSVQQEVEDQIALLMADGNIRFETTMQRLDGSLFEGEVSAMLIQLKDRQLIQSIVRDISRRAESSRMLAASERKYRQLVEISPTAIFLFDSDMRFIDSNKAGERLLGYNRDELMQLAIADVDADPDAVQAAHQQLHAGDSIANFEHDLRRKNGDIITVLNNSIALKDDRGRVTNWLSYLMDITLEKQRQKKLEHVQRLESLGVLAGGIAHDFNNLLTAVMGHAALARMGMNPMDACMDHITAIEDTSQRAADLCNQMLAYSGKGRFVVQPVDLSCLVHEMVRLLEVSIHKGVVMRYELADGLPAIDADLAQLQQVIMNLVINANEAIGNRSGMIMLTTGLMHADESYLRSVYVEEEALSPGRYVYLEVSDTGCGMDETTIRRIFEPFYTTKFTGRGLGMSAILGIVRGHHGAIKLYTEQGKGSSLKVLFPVSDGAAIALQQDGGIDSEQRGEGLILLVDDEETVREVAAMMLEQAGYRVIHAVDGVDGVEKLKLHVDEIYCVLLDMTMPRMGGAEAFSEMRRIKPDVRVILTSGYNEQSATQRFAGKGLAGFVQKPYRPDVLLARIAGLHSAGGRL